MMGVLTVQELNVIYADKLAKTGSHDEATLKTNWVAYLTGFVDAAEATPEMIAEARKALEKAKGV